ncbi:hypothetical protein JTE90_016657 [Oedothorax gibbosus]|uniref:Uncharacterized protein n=1 Tax=Oedothorax gibbosus TaxID=931172 RepID=A0AAV6V3E3_9ARAC|nr:hypothetical protein JTE90_016657 [Oedothorax gibbosus]
MATKNRSSLYFSPVEVTRPIIFQGWNFPSLIKDSFSVFPLKVRHQKNPGSEITAFYNSQKWRSVSEQEQTKATSGHRPSLPQGVNKKNKTGWVSLSSTRKSVLFHKWSGSSFNHIFVSACQRKMERELFTIERLKTMILLKVFEEK